MLINIPVEIPFSTSDHNTICFDLKTLKPSAPANAAIVLNTPVKYDFSNIDHAGLVSSQLITDWRNVLSQDDDINNAWNSFNFYISSLKANYIPVKKISFARKTSALPPNILHLIKMKKAAWMRYKKNRHKGVANRKIFYRLVKTVKSSIFAHWKAVEEKILSGSVKIFFNYSNSRLHPFVSSGPMKDNGNNLIDCDLGKAEFFSEFFHTVCTYDDNNSPIFASRTDSIMQTPIFTVAHVKRTLIEKKSSTSCGPDGVAHFFLKKFPELNEPLRNLFNISIQQVCVPQVMENRKLIPLYEGKGSMLEVKNNLAISLTNFTVKPWRDLFAAKLCPISSLKICFPLVNLALDQGYLLYYN